MKIEQATRPHEHCEFSLEELCEPSGLSEAELRDLGAKLLRGQR